MSRPEGIGRSLAGVLNGPQYSAEQRALLYACGKREDVLRDELVDLAAGWSPEGSAQREWGVPAADIVRWNEALHEAGYFSDPSGLEKEKQRARVDVVAFDRYARPCHFVEVKAWSATDAVDPTRYHRAKKYNHSLSKAFEIDALKLRSIGSTDVRRTIVTAMFTMHCDGLSVASMKTLGLGYVSLNGTQNKDKRGIGSSDAYRERGVTMMMENFERSFGRRTPTEAEIVHVVGFPRTEACYGGVDVSLDLVVATLYCP